MPSWSCPSTTPKTSRIVMKNAMEHGDGVADSHRVLDTDWCAINHSKSSRWISPEPLSFVGKCLDRPAQDASDPELIRIHTCVQREPPTTRRGCTRRRRRTGAASARATMPLEAADLRRGGPAAVAHQLLVLAKRDLAVAVLVQLLKQARLRFLRGSVSMYVGVITACILVGAALAGGAGGRRMYRVDLLTHPRVVPCHST